MYFTFSFLVTFILITVVPAVTDSAIMALYSLWVNCGV